MKRARTVLSLLLAILLLASCLPMSAWAAEPAGTPYEASAPKGGNYTISTAAQLKALAETVNGGETYEGTTFTLIDDIDLSTVCGAELNGGTNWEPIGNDGAEFTGSFDGGNHKVTGLYINAWPDGGCVGLFGYLNGGVVKNLSVDSTVKGDTFVGGIVGYMTGGTVENCHHTSGAIDGIILIGGVVGYNKGGTVKNCSNAGTVAGQGNLGGVVGELDESSTVEQCYNVGNVTAYKIDEDSNATSGSDLVSGIAGANGGTIKNCYSTGEISGEDCGGVTAWNGGTIETCYNFGQINGKRSSGGVVATNDGTAKNCYYLEGTANGGYENGDVPGEAEKLTVEAFKDLANFIGFDSNIWADGIVVERPILRDNAESLYEDTDGTYLIPDLDTLEWFCGEINRGNSGISGKLTADIDLSEKYHEGANWTPIGANNHPFTGVFDGDNHEITGLYINDETASMRALFGYVAGGTIKNLSVDGSVIGKHAAILVGGTWRDSIIENCHASGFVNGESYAGGVVASVFSPAEVIIQDCSNAASVSGGLNVGGIAGGSQYIVRNCYNTGSISESTHFGDLRVGGIVGQNSGTVENCYNTGTITVSRAGVAAGIVGYSRANDQTIQNCYNAGTVSSAYDAGGVVGWNMTALKNCYNTGDVTGTNEVGGVTATCSGEAIENCYNFGSVSGGKYMGGVMGRLGKDGALQNCYYLETTASGGINGADVPGQAEKLTAAEFKSTENFKSWDFATIWEMGKDKNGNPVRPILKNPKEDPLQALPGESEPPTCGCENCDETKCSCTGGCTDGKCTCEGCNPQAPSEPECTCKDCDSGKCNCAGDCTGNTCKCAGCSGKPDTGDSGNTGDNPGGGTVVPDDEEPYEPDPACPQDSTCPIAKFTDTSVTGWYHDAVHYVLEHGLMSGTGSTTFEPDSTLSRAMLVQILYNLEGKPTILGSTLFDDVSESAWYADAVAWAASNGVVSGNGDGTFAPESAITREQVAVILHNYARYVGRLNVHIIGDISGFTDAGKLSDWAISAMQWAVGSGLISGKGGGILDPVGDSTRAEAATVLMKFCEGQ